MADSSNVDLGSSLKKGKDFGVHEDEVLIDIQSNKK
jgi:hypothetical protein